MLTSLFCIDPLVLYIDNMRFVAVNIFILISANMLWCLIETFLMSHNNIMGESLDISKIMNFRNHSFSYLIL